MFVPSPGWELRGTMLPGDSRAVRAGCEVLRAVKPQDLLRRWFYNLLSTLRCSEEVLVLCKVQVFWKKTLLSN